MTNLISSMTPLHEYDLFALHPTQITVEKDICQEYRSTTSLSTYPSTISFEINSASDEYIQFKETEFYLRIRVDLTPTNKTRQITVDDWKLVSPVNNLLHSMIKQVTVYIGNCEITTANNTYAYLAYMDRLLYEGDNSKNTCLQSALWYLDNPGIMDDVNTKRQSFIMNKTNTDLTRGQELDLIDTLSIDLSKQERAIIGGSKININILLNDPEFYLVCPESLKCTVTILEAALYVHKSKVNPKVVEAHELALRKTTAKYPINRKEVKNFTVLPGVMDYHINNIYNIVLPRRVYVCFVTADSFIGSYKKNPFNFQHFKLREICCYYNGAQYPMKPYTPDFEKGKYIREFYGLFEAANQKIGETAISINRGSYANGFTIFGFNFAPDLSDGPDSCGYCSRQSYGNLRIEIKFAKTIEQPINVLVFSEFDSLIEINHERKGIKNFS
jgi:hypothetical protein